MDTTYFNIVKSDGDYYRVTSLNETIPGEQVLFRVKMEETPVCQTYSHYRGRVVDAYGNESSFYYKGYLISFFEITGDAEDYRLVFRYKCPDSTQNEWIFRDDIRYNIPLEDYKRTGIEWTFGTLYKVILEYIDNVEKYGEEAYRAILGLKRELYAKDAEKRQVEDELKQKKTDNNLLRDCIQEIYIPSGWTDIPLGLFDGIDIRRVYIPETVESIAYGAFGINPHDKEVFCLATTPPKLYNIPDWGKWKIGKTLFVPREALKKYQEDENWAAAFNVIKAL